MFKETFSIEPVFSSTKWRCSEAEVFFHMVKFGVFCFRQRNINFITFLIRDYVKNFHTSWFVLGSSLYAETIILNLRSTFFTLHIPYMEHIMIY